jgi:hypothetical protein
LTALSKADAPVSVTLTLDKGAGKILGWLIGMLVAFAFLAAFALAMAYSARDMAIKAETEFRLVDDWMQTHGIRKINGRYQFVEESHRE